MMSVCLLYMMTHGTRMFCFYDIIQYKYESVVDDLLMYLLSHLYFSHIWWHMGTGCTTLMMNVIHSVWDYISTLRNVWTDRFISAWWDLDLHAWHLPSQSKIIDVDVTLFFLHIYKCDDVGYIQWCMMIPSIRTHYFDTHGTYATWDYIIQYKYENVVDDILI